MCTSKQPKQLLTIEMPQKSDTTQADKCIGIDPEKLLSEKVLSNQTSFWTEMKAQTDELQNHYLQREKRIYITLQRIQQSERYCTSDQIVKRLQKLHMDVSSLIILVEDSLEEFVSVVTEFDAHHDKDTLETETELLHNSYDFINCDHLRRIISTIEARIEEHSHSESHIEEDVKEAEPEQVKSRDCCKDDTDFTECTNHISLDSCFSDFSISRTNEKKFNKSRSRFYFKQLFRRKRDNMSTTILMK